MNQLKDYALENEMRYIITYADNNAIKFFKKQGFLAVENFPGLKKIKRYVEYYDQATLMGFIVHDQCDYIKSYDISFV